MVSEDGYCKLSEIKRLLSCKGFSDWASEWLLFDFPSALCSLSLLYLLGYSFLFFICKTSHFCCLTFILLFCGEPVCIVGLLICFPASHLVLDSIVCTYHSFVVLLGFNHLSFSVYLQIQMILRAPQTQMHTRKKGSPRVRKHPRPERL